MTGRLVNKPVPRVFDLSTLSQITDRLIMSANVRSVLLFTGNSGNSLWLAALGGSIGSRVCVMLKKNVDTEVDVCKNVGVGADCFLANNHI